MLQLYDLAGVYFRAFYALPTSITAPDGSPVNAVRGSLDILARVISDARPTRGVACLDLDWRPAWRVDVVPSYKAHRVAMPAAASPSPASGAAGAAELVPDELEPQVPVLLDVLRAVGIPLAGAPECEADDVIGTLAAREATDPVEVVSGDRDLFQVIRTDPTPVTVRYIGAGMNKTQLMDSSALRQRYGVDGAGYAAMATLRGDPSDGLPGVNGIGEKTAAALLTRFGSIDALLGAVDDPGSALAPGARAKLTAAREYIRAAARVVLVRADAPVDLSSPGGGDALPTAPADPQALRALSERYGLGRSVDRLLGALAGLAR